MDGISAVSGVHADYSGQPGNVAVGAMGHYTSSRMDFIARFYQCLQQWHSETVYESDLDAILAHPSYRRIVDLGFHAVPLIVDHLKVQPSLLVFALEDITGERPFSSDLQGDISGMTDAWVLWADREDLAA